MRRNLWIFVAVVFLLSCFGGLEGCATHQIKSDDPFVMAKAAYYDASLWYNNTLETYLRYRPGLKPDRAKALNGLFLECGKTLDIWNRAIESGTLSKDGPKRFDGVKKRILDKADDILKRKEVS